MFALTDGLIRMSAKGAANKDELVNAISGRLHALASSHSLVSRHLLDVGQVPRTGDLGALIRAVVAPHDTNHAATASKFTLRGPVVPCGDKALTGLALIFHELATNAAKYGALSAEAGRIEIDWLARDAGELVIVWTERGGPSVLEPQREGFGSSLIKTTITSQFAGSIARTWRHDGLVVQLRVGREHLMC
jgi:two-component sensor histidine kinase